jgi:hypothetical protein
MRHVARLRLARSAAGVPIGPGERVLTTTHEVSGAPVVATGHAIYHQDRAAGGRSWARLGWEDVDRIQWDESSSALVLTRLRGSELQKIALHLARHAPVVELARERVTWTILASAPVLSRGRVCGQLAARRRPGSDDVRWVFTLQDGTAGDPALRSRVSGTIAALEAELGFRSGRPASSDGRWPGHDLHR